MQVSDRSTPADAGVLNLIDDTIAKTSSATSQQQRLRLADDMCRRHQTSLVQIQAVIFDLVAPRFGMAREPTSASERRLGLACMMGFKVGLGADEARHVVDCARAQPERTIASYVARKLSAYKQAPLWANLGANTPASSEAELVLYQQDVRILAGIRGDEALLLGMRAIQGSPVG